MAEFKSKCLRCVEVAIFVVLVGLVTLQEYAAITMDCGTLSHGFGFLKHADAASRQQPSYYEFRFAEPPVLLNTAAENDEAWTAAVMPQGEGYLWEKHNETTDLEYGVSMFHALHCLKMIRSGLKGSIRGGSSEQKRHGSSRKTHESEVFLHENHIPHCIGYLAQYISCAGDGTIEPPWATKDNAGRIREKGVDGMGFTHMCKDTSLLWEVVERSSKEAIQPWDWNMDDTVESIFG